MLRISATNYSLLSLTLLGKLTGYGSGRLEALAMPGLHHLEQIKYPLTALCLEYLLNQHLKMA